MDGILFCFVIQLYAVTVKANFSNSEFIATRVRGRSRRTESAAAGGAFIDWS